MPSKQRSSSPKKKGINPAEINTKVNQSDAQDKSLHKHSIDDDDMYRPPIINKIRPHNQVQLSTEKLAEEFTQVLTATDPNISNNTVKYNYKEKTFKTDPEGPMDNLAFHFSMNGASLHKDSDEANTQKAYEDELKHRRDLHTKELAVEAQEIGEEHIDLNLIRGGKSQFNYSERAVQTISTGMRSRGAETEPPAVVRFQATVSQWDIYDSYMVDYRSHQSDDVDKKKNPAAVGTLFPADCYSTLGVGVTGVDMVHSKRMADSLKIIERMVNQNASDEVYQDYKYWEDASDSFRSGLGSLLPLWKFSHERCKRKHVTALKWSAQYHDLFAVGYGSFDFLHQGSGIVCCFSLKNNSYPEYMITVESGVMCVDFHPQYPSLLAIGCYDGSVMVYDIKMQVKKALYCSTSHSGRHTDPVWQVRWQDSNLTGAQQDLCLYSISSDGQVASWSMSKSELKLEPIMQLKLVRDAVNVSLAVSTVSFGSISNPASVTLPSEESDEIRFSGLAGGCCFDFNPSAGSEHIFLVGTEEGKIHKCSRSCSGQYLETYFGHNMPVYAIKWNPYHPDVFISCSADWHVLIWDQNHSRPLISLDLGTAVGDVCWAPYSSTTFAAVSSDGKVYVYDLSVNAREPLCEQRVVKKTRLTRISFNRDEPVLIVGDEKGSVLSLKLSPNLRLKQGTAVSDDSVTVSSSDEATEQKKSQSEMQIKRLELILQAARI